MPGGLGVGLPPPGRAEQRAGSSAPAGGRTRAQGAGPAGLVCLWGGHIGGRCFPDEWKTWWGRPGRGAQRARREPERPNHAATPLSLPLGNVLRGLVPVDRWTGVGTFLLPRAVSLARTPVTPRGAPAPCPPALREGTASAGSLLASARWGQCEGSSGRGPGPEWTSPRGRPHPVPMAAMTQVTGVKGSMPSTPSGVRNGVGTLTGQGQWAPERQGDRTEGPSRPWAPAGHAHEGQGCWGEWAGRGVSGLPAVGGSRPEDRV